MNADHLSGDGDDEDDDDDDDEDVVVEDPPPQSLLKSQSETSHKYIIGSTLKIILQISDCLSDSLMRRVSTHQILRIIAPYRVYPSTLDICGARKTVDLQQL